MNLIYQSFYRLTGEIDRSDISKEENESKNLYKSRTDKRYTWTMKIVFKEQRYKRTPLLKAVRIKTRELNPLKIFFFQKNVAFWNLERSEY